MRTLFTILLLSISIVAHAQDPMYATGKKQSAALLDQSKRQDGFMLTPRGFVAGADDTKSYLVVEFPGVPQAELYKRAQAYLHRIYKSPKDVLSQLEHESITVNGFAEKAVPRTSLHVFDIRYSINLQFKDNRMRINAPDFDLTTFTTQHQELKLVANNAFDGSTLGIYNTKGVLKSPKAKDSLEAFFKAYIGLLVKAMHEPNAETDNW